MEQGALGMKFYHLIWVKYHDWRSSKHRVEGAYQNSTFIHHRNRLKHHKAMI
jgi:hypothetical protein